MPMELVWVWPTVFNLLIKTQKPSFKLLEKKKKKIENQEPRRKGLAMYHSVSPRLSTLDSAPSFSIFIPTAQNT